MKTEENFKYILEEARAKGLRLTPQRIELIRALSGTRGHPTADELLREVRSALPSVTLATIHRNIHDLVEAGLISKLEWTGGATQYDPNIEDHHHFVCRKCGEITDIYLDQETFDINRPRGELGEAKIDSFQVQFRGICARCQDPQQTNPQDS